MKYFITGGLGFIGSNLARKLIKEDDKCSVVVYDNLSNGNIFFLLDIINSDRLKIIIADIKEKEELVSAMNGCDIVYHFASNADIAKATSDPSIDFYEGTILTERVLEAMRINGVKKIVYASGSGVYGNYGEKELHEDHYPMLPISPYGASKLAGEALISAYSNMFEIQARVYRFANVIGKNQTHGVGYSFVKQLLSHPDYLDIMGRGNQSKSYVHVSDILNAITKPNFKNDNMYEYYNVSTKDYITVLEIANIVTEIMELKNVEYIFQGNSEGGWKGDIPVVRLNSDKIRKTGWNNKYTSLEAMKKSIEEILEEHANG